jgi:hypothetical protein
MLLGVQRAEQQKNGVGQTKKTKKGEKSGSKVGSHIRRPVFALVYFSDRFNEQRRFSQCRGPILQTGLPDFFVQYTNKGENVQKYIPQNIPNSQKNISNGCKIHQMSIKYTNIFLCKALQNLTKLQFLA